MKVTNYPRRVAIFGTGGHGRELAWLLESSQVFDVECFVHDDASRSQELNGLSVLAWEAFVAERPCQSIVVAIGDLHGRERVVTRCVAERLRFPALVDQSVRLSRYVEVGEGAVVCAGTVLTINIVIGKHVHINRCCSISHDVAIGDFSTLSPGVNVSGHVQIGSRVFIGSGATIVNGSTDMPLTIADGSIIGAGACVTASILHAGTYVGVPAREVTHKLS